VLNQFADQFDGIYKVRRDSSDRAKTDPSMYLGSAGYSFALHRVLKFLRYDAQNSEEPLFDIEKAQKMLEASL
jgi:hypothetical protein